MRAFTLPRSLFSNGDDSQVLRCFPNPICSSSSLSGRLSFASTRIHSIQLSQAKMTYCTYTFSIITAPNVRYNLFCDALSHKQEQRDKNVPIYPGSSEISIMYIYTYARPAVSCRVTTSYMNRASMVAEPYLRKRGRAPATDVCQSSAIRPATNTAIAKRPEICVRKSAPFALFYTLITPSKLRCGYLTLPYPAKVPCSFSWYEFSDATIPLHRNLGKRNGPGIPASKRRYIGLVSLCFVAVDCSASFLIGTEEPEMKEDDD